MDAIWQHFSTFLTHAAFPQEAEDFLLDAAATIQKQDLVFSNLLDSYIANDFSAPAIREAVFSFAEQVNLPPETVWLILLMCTSYQSQLKFSDCGYSDQLYWDIFLDLATKCHECHDVRGIWGTFVPSWYDRFFKLNIFRFGRLQFERIHYEGEKSLFVDGYEVKPGSPVYSVHIPSDGGSFPKEARQASYAAAKTFFQSEIGVLPNGDPAPMVLFCDSWLLYPDNKQAFPSAHNIHSFMEEWHVVRTSIDENLGNAWRIFGKEYKGDITALPQRSSLHREYVQWMQNGGKLGGGAGYQVIY